MKKSDLPAGLLQPLLYSLSCKIASARARIHQMSKGVRQLYDNFRPEHYQIDLAPSVKDMLFNGTVTITGQKVGRPSKRLTLHQKDLIIINAEVIRNDKKGNLTHKIARINHHRSYHEVRLHSDTMLFPGKYTVKLTFKGKLTTVMQGIYPCKFTDKDKEKIILATQFEAPHAREAFPCIDEPEAKATFQLSLTSPNDQVVLSNTPIEKQQTIRSKGANSALIKTTFETTPRMSTYLLAFVIGDLHSVEAKTKAGIIVRSWGAISRPKDQLQYSVDEAVRALDFFSNYFGIAYPLTKLDQVALPDFDAGAMENWGLVTYRETALLADPNNRSISSEQFITMVICHELSHQWFGNLVTMKWWDDLWLNESFAGLMEHLAPATLHPDWQQWELYAASDIALITSRDVYKDIQPVGVEITDPDLIESAFDPAIVYAKGARLIKMLVEYIGQEAFVKGLKSYFAANAYGSASRHDLWRALSESSHKNIESFMVPWLTQPGMPVVHVSQNGNVLELKQERFLLDSEPDSTLWPIPLLANTESSTDKFETMGTTIKLKSSGYVLLNQYASGQYITHYTEPAHRDYLAQLIESGKVPTEARINLLNDMYMLARHGDSSLIDNLNLIKKCSREPRDSVWGLIARALGAANQLTEGNKIVEKQLNTFKTNLARYWYSKLGWEDSTTDDPNTKQLRHTMIALMTVSQDKNAIKEALKRYAAAKHLSDINAELRSTILIAAVRHGSKTVVPALLTAYQNASPDLQQDITVALTSTKKPDEARQIIAKALGKDGFVRAQDVMRWLAMFLRNYHTRDIAWDFMYKNWDWLQKTLGDSKSFDYLPTYAASTVSTPAGAKRYRDFFEPKRKIKTLEHNIKLGYADIEARVAWRKREEAKIKLFFKDQSKS